MKVEWDPQKAEANYKKHRVRFSDAESALFDPFALSKEDHDIESEKRFVSIGAIQSDASSSWSILIGGIPFE